MLKEYGLRAGDSKGRLWSNDIVLYDVLGFTKKLGDRNALEILEWMPAHL